MNNDAHKLRIRFYSAEEFKKFNDSLLPMQRFCLSALNDLKIKNLLYRENVENPDTCINCHVELDSVKSYLEGLY